MYIVQQLLKLEVTTFFNLFDCTAELLTTGTSYYQPPSDDLKLLWRQPIQDQSITVLSWPLFSYMSVREINFICIFSQNIYWWKVLPKQKIVKQLSASTSTGRYLSVQLIQVIPETDFPEVLQDISAKPTSIESRTIVYWKGAEFRRIY